MRERATGSTYGLGCTRKGADDVWAVQRLAEKLESWGLGDIVLWVKSDGEAAIKNLQRALREARAGGTSLLNSAVHCPWGNGVAERAVK